MCRKPKLLRSAVGRGSGYSRMRGISESFLKPLWERFPLERYAHRLTPPTETTHQVVSLPGYAGRPLRFAFLSDFHAGPTTSPRLFDSAFEYVEAARPDAVLLGGDYVYFDADNIDMLGKHFEKLAKRSPIFGVWGNHDLWADDVYLARFFANAGVSMLCNEWERSLQGEPIDLYGVDDPWTGSPDFAPLAEAEKPVVLLCHNPDGILFLEPEHRADLMLFGHTHGGQVCRRDGSPYMVHAKTGTRFAGGRYLHDDRQIIVSRGIGTVEVPIRRFAPPEVVIIDLVPSAELTGMLMV